MQRVDVTSEGWDQYQLLDTGDGRKLERFGDLVLDRPDPQSIWKKENPEIWKDADASFSWAEKGERWKERKGFPESWSISYKNLRFSLSLKQLKHVGLFPEHVLQWEELEHICREHPELRVLNLFGYTGAASLVAANVSARVTHVDASKQAIALVKENMSLSGLRNDAIRLVCEDALKYVKRLINREERFDVIIMDPPAFGRGPKGEIWKIEEKLPELISFLPKLLSANAKLVILNGYAAGYAARSFGELLRDAMRDRRGAVTYGDILIRQNIGERSLTTGIYAAWSA